MSEFNPECITRVETMVNMGGNLLISYSVPSCAVIRQLRLTSDEARCEFRTDCWTFHGHLRVSISL